MGVIGRGALLVVGWWVVWGRAVGSDVEDVVAVLVFSVAGVPQIVDAGGEGLPGHPTTYYPVFFVAGYGDCDALL